MKPIVMALVWPLAAALALVAQPPANQKAGDSPKPAAAPVVKCKGPDAKPCTARQVQALSDAVYSGKNHHDALVPVKELSLAASDGSLKCAQGDGTPCTTPQLDAIKMIAADQQLYINYNSSKSNTGNIKE